jgi:ATP-dependent Lon protease
MAALRNGISTVIIPQDNVRDLEEIDQTVREALRFVPVSTIDEVLSEALEQTVSKPSDEAAAFAPSRRESETAALRQ